MNSNITHQPHDRLVVLDTETTGIDPEYGHRIIEIGCVEIINGRITSNYFQQYINPDRDIPQASIRIHGITNNMVINQPYFHEIVDGFLSFINNSYLIIHNASFDIKFINHHLRLIKYKELKTDKVIDTLMMAKRRFLGASATLDALCKRYNISLKNRTQHGALIDAKLLARVYIEMEFNSKISLLDNNLATQNIEQVTCDQDIKIYPINDYKFKIITPTQDEINHHNSFIQNIKDKAINLIF